jgi:hypothetical protein
MSEIGMPETDWYAVWKARIGLRICAYYDGYIGVLEDVRPAKYGMTEIKVNGHWRESHWCSVDADGERSLHPDVYERQETERIRRADYLPYEPTEGF